MEVIENDFFHLKDSLKNTDWFTKETPLMIASNELKWS